MTHLFSAGACKGLFQGLFAKQLQAAQLNATFGAEGAIREKLLNGEACELLVLTLPLMQQLIIEKWIEPSTLTILGEVGTGIAVNSASIATAGKPDISQIETLKANLLATTFVHVPDPQQATAGIHFKRLLQELGIEQTMEPRCRFYPNGATAMAALAKASQAADQLQIGCAQVSEILSTPGVHLLAELPKPYRSRSIYAAALTPSGIESPEALAILKKLSTTAARALARSGGIYPQENQYEG
jgi:molybdate transport system substrate-binding protein